MRILLISVGTRGDIEPFLTIANLLKENGHETICCFPEQFRELTEKSGIEFIGLSSKFLELLDSSEGKIAMGGKASIFKKIKAYYHLYKKSSIINQILVNQQYQYIQELKPDKVIYNIKSIYPLVWSIENPKKTILISPIPYLIHFTKNHGHIGFNKNYGLFINRITYGIANFGLIKNVMSAVKGLPSCGDIKSRELKKVLFNTKMLFTISPIVFPRPSYWKEDVQIVGYPERTTTPAKIPSELETFLERHGKVVFVTFGSMVNDSPKEKTKVIVDLLQDYQIPAIINTASGGLLEMQSYNKGLIMFVNKITYDSIFPKVYAVIHHGGAGTTHLALKHGCSSLILPHIIDQFLWRNIVHDLGVGPKGIAIKKMTRLNLEPRILDLFQNNVYKERAKQISGQMKMEKGIDQLYNLIID